MSTLGLLTRAAPVETRAAIENRERAITALHEAGHAIAATLLRLFFDYVCLQERRLFYGRRQHFHGGPHYELRRAACALAGDAAVRLVYGNRTDRRYRRACGKDYRNAGRFLCGLGPDAPPIEKVFAAVQELLDQHLGPLADVALALLQRGKLSYREVRDIVHGYPLEPYGQRLAKLL